MKLQNIHIQKFWAGDIQGYPRVVRKLPLSEFALSLKGFPTHNQMNLTEHETNYVYVRNSTNYEGYLFVKNCLIS